MKKIILYIGTSYGTARCRYYTTHGGIVETCVYSRWDTEIEARLCTGNLSTIVAASARVHSFALTIEANNIRHANLH